MLHPAPISRQPSYAGSHRPRTTSHYSIATTAEEEEEGAIEMIPSSLSPADDTLDALEAGDLPTSRSLEHTIDRIGLGPYQYRLLILCGLGWTSDNATLQSLALILPRVATHFSLTPTTSSFLSASLMFGMLIGSIGWGSASDVIGRRIPFNATLGLTGVFGLLGSWVGSFGGLCVVMMLVGSAVGGSMPTDGTLFLGELGCAVSMSPSKYPSEHPSHRPVTRRKPPRIKTIPPHSPLDLFLPRCGRIQRHWIHLASRSLVFTKQGGVVSGLRYRSWG